MYKDLIEYAKTISGHTKDEMIKELKFYAEVLLDGEPVSDYQMARILSEACSVVR